jgi:AraC-like DNA-binding protein
LSSAVADQPQVGRRSAPRVRSGLRCGARFAAGKHRGGTVAQQIQRTRLERCRRELVDPRCDTRSVTDISRRWGFPDLATFSRAFRAAYGMSPTDWRSARPS